MITYLVYLAIVLYVVATIRYIVIDVRDVADTPADVFVVVIMSALWLPIQLWIACTIAIRAWRDV